MHFHDLRQYLEHLDRHGALRRVKAPVNLHLEMSEILDRLVRQEGPAVLFEQPVRDGVVSPIPVVAGLFASHERMRWALGVTDLAEAAARVEELLKLAQGPGAGGGSLLSKLAMLPKLQELARIAPKTVRQAPVQEVVEEGEAVDVRRLPIATSWPEDAAPFITLPQVITHDPETGRRNVGMYRLQVRDRNTLGMHWQRHHGGAWNYARARGRHMPVAVALGGDPVSIYAAMAPVPDGLDEYLFAGLLRGEPVELVPAKTVDLLVPAHAEIILEGYVDPSEPLQLEGPFGDHTGFYSLPELYPNLHVTAITRRRQPLYPHTLAGRPPKEDFFMGHASGRIFKPILQMLLPEVVDYHLPDVGVFTNVAFVSIEKRHPGQAYKVASAFWGLGQMSLVKTVIVFDADVNVQDPDECWWLAFMNIDPERDVKFFPGPIDVLDHASRLPAFGTKMVIDATRKTAAEGFQRPWPNRVRMTPAIQAQVTRRWSEYGL